MDAGQEQLYKQKTRALMRSIEVLRQQVDQLKAEKKDTYQAKQVQQLKKEKRELELVADVLKEELRRSRGLSPEEMDEEIIRKTVGGPKRFRPKTREELAVEIRELQNKLNAASRKAPRTTRMQTPVPQTTVSIPQETIVTQSAEDREKISDLLETIDELRIELAARERSSKGYVDTIAELRNEVKTLQLVRDKLDHTSEKYSRMKKNFSKMQTELVSTRQQYEELEDEFQRIEAENVSLKEASDKSLSRNEEREAELLETVQSLRSNEAKLLKEIDAVQLQLAEVKQRAFMQKTSAESESNLRKQVNELVEENQALQKSCESARLQYQNYQNMTSKEKSDSTTRLNNLEVKLAEQLEAANEFQKEIKGLKNALHQAQTNLVKSEETNETLRQKNEELQTSRGGQTMALDPFASNLTLGDQAGPPPSARSKSSARSTTPRDSEKEDLRKQLDKIEDELKSYKISEEDFKQEISSTKTQSRKFEILLDEAKKRILDLQDETHELHALVYAKLADTPKFESLANDIQSFYNNLFREMATECNRDKAAAACFRTMVERLQQYIIILHKELKVIGRKIPPVPVLEEIAPLPTNTRDIRDKNGSEDVTDAVKQNMNTQAHAVVIPAVDLNIGTTTGRSSGRESPAPLPSGRGSPAPLPSGRVSSRLPSARELSARLSSARDQATREPVTREAPKREFPAPLRESSASARESIAQESTTTTKTSILSDRDESEGDDSETSDSDDDSFSESKTDTYYVNDSENDLSDDDDDDDLSGSDSEEDDDIQSR